MPVLCNYYITLKCNAKCEFCNIWSDESYRNIEEQSLDDIRNNLNDLKKLGVKVIDFTGGEPLLSPNLIDALKISKKLGFFTTITTNTILYPMFAEKLKGLVDSLSFSFGSSDKNKHNKIRGVDCYDSLLKSLKIANDLKQKVILLYVVTDDNISELDDVVKFSQKNKIPIKLTPCFSYFGNKGLNANFADHIKKYYKQPYVCADLAHVEFVKNMGNDISKPMCKAIDSTVVISPDNYLLLPCFHKNTCRLKIENNLYDLYNSEKTQKMKSMDGKWAFCKGCTIYCYMRSSYYKSFPSKYFFLFVRSQLKTLFEYMKPKI